MIFSRKLLKETITSVQKLIKHDLNIVTADKYIISVKAGNGGTGLARYNGCGGYGGNVYFVAKPNVAFTDIKRKLKSKMKIRADPGVSANKLGLIGAHGKHEYFEVPIGIEVVDRENNTLIARCSRPFNKYLIARGGEGGSANTGYKGLPGQALEIEVHLKLRPNIGLLGFPNAGKSTILKAFVPEKSVKIADYPFTTVNPQVAFWNSSTPSTSSTSPLAENFTVSLADLPGIIEGASRNRGRGYQFLKHLEYADIVLMVVDCQGFQLKNELDCPFRTPLESIALLNKEVENYDKKLAKKPIVLVLNKIDLLESDESRDNIQSLQNLLKTKNWWMGLPEEFRPTIPMRFENVIQLSAKSGKIEELQKVLTGLRHHIHALTDVPENSNFEEKPRKKRLL
ncbi:unnamed protein product [Caenorhabditis angaria]|uniref:OBG-type G domain-containing protein n=1 Tax=Caenorhabditis angaria TaxID=860376 RepID=A0A9P1IH19_9PELO|nr:unnamed protein product [Caenorhabditis angaria]